MDISKVISIFKLPVKVNASILLVSGVLLFAPTSFISKLGLAFFKGKSNLYIGIIFLSSTTIVLISIGDIFLKYFKQKIKNHNQKKIYFAFLKSLSPTEKKILNQYFDEQSTTQYFEIEDGIVNGLEAKKYYFVRQMFLFFTQHLHIIFNRGHGNILIKISIY